MTASVMSAVCGSNEISLSISHLFCIYFTSFAAERNTEFHSAQ